MPIRALGPRRASRFASLRRFAALLGFLWAAISPAATFTVSTTNSAGAGSLAQAVTNVNNTAGTHTIVFDASLNGATIDLAGTTQAVTRAVEIDARSLSRGLTVRGNNTARLFRLTGSSTTVRFFRIRFAGGNAGAGNGGACEVTSQANAVFSDCTFQDNTASLGGAIASASSSRADIYQCTFYRNIAADSGAAYLLGPSDILNSTFTGNRATAASGTGAISVFASTQCYHLTVFENVGGSSGGGIYFSGSLILSRCLLAGNTATGTASPDLYKGAGSVTTGGASNLLGSNGAGGSGSVATEFPSGPRVGTPGSPLDPRLRPLGPGGGPTDTLAPLTGSPAIDVGGVSTLATDQRGFPRPPTGPCDLGAVERGPIVTVTNTSDAGPGSLRAALIAVTTPDTRIQFAAGLSGATITLANGSLVPPSGSTMEIDGSTLGAPLTISGDGLYRILDVFQPASLCLHRVILARGLSNDGFGGGAITLENSSLLAVDCTVTGSFSPNDDGAGANIALASRAVLHRCTISDNEAPFAGGGIVVRGTSDLSLFNCTVSGNRSANGGGILVLGEGRLDLVHTTVTENQGAGVYKDNGSIRLERSIIAGNQDSGGSPDIYLEAGTITVVSPNLVGNDGGGSFGNVSGLFPSGPLVGTPEAPLAARLAPLFRGGGFTATHALLSGSPALDAAGTSPLRLDQRGFPRGLGGASDLGALERGPVTTVTTAAGSGAGSLRQALLDASTSGGPVILFAPSLDGASIPVTGNPLERTAGDVFVDATGLSQGITVQGDGSTRLLAFIDPATSVALHRLRVSGGRQAASNGGAMLILDARVGLFDCTFEDNSANIGGAIFANGTGSLTASGCTFARNSAADTGALWLEGTTPSSLRNCTFSGNQCTGPSGTGAITFLNGPVTLTHVTVTENAGTAFGGGVYAASRLTLDSSLLAGNTAAATVSPDYYQAGSVSTNGRPTLLGSNGDGQSGSASAAFPGSVIVGTPAAPLPAQLAPLQRRGGFTATHTLLTDSPAHSLAGPSPLLTDQRGFPRGVNGGFDLGAVERGQLVGVFNTEASGPGSLRQALLDASATPDAIILFDPALNGQSIPVINDALTIAGGNVFIDASNLPRGLNLRANNTTRLFTITGAATSVTLVRLRCFEGDAGTDAGGGGGIRATDASVGLVDCTFQDNVAVLGGAIRTQGLATLTASGCLFYRNLADDAAGIYLGGSGASSFRNCTLTANRSLDPLGTGAIVAVNGPVQLSHVTVYENSGGDRGGGIWSAGALTIERCVIAANTATGSNSPDLFLGGGSIQTNGAPNLVGSNGAGQNGSASSVFAAGPLVGTPASPLDPRLRPLGPSGGLSATLAPLTGSPALDAAGVSPLATDQRGFPRGVNGASDLGAVERGPVATVIVASDSGPGSLRAALAAVTAPDTRLQFAAGLSGATITLTSASLVPLGGTHLEIDGSTLSVPLTISGADQFRVLDNTADASLSLNRLVITKGRASDAFPGGVLYTQDSQFLAVDCTFTDNFSTTAGGAFFFPGSTRAALHRCTIANNRAIGDVGGIIVQESSELALLNCTVASNRGEPNIGGIELSGSARLDLVHTTVSGNSTPGTAGGIVLQGSAYARLQRSVIAGNTDTSGSPDISFLSGRLAASGPSLVGNNGTGTSGDASSVFPAGPLAGTPAAPLDPKLGPLQYNGGFTATHAPLAGSPALNATGAPTQRLDQRGLPRGAAGAAELGSVERGPVLVVTTAADSGPGSLRAALGLATAPDTQIVFAIGLNNAAISVNSPLVLGATQHLTVDASALSAGVRLQGNASARLWQVPAGATLSLVRLGLTGGSSTASGGAILNDGGTLGLVACDLFTNSAANGGAIFGNAGRTELSGCRLVGNTASSSASALGRSGSALVAATDCWFGSNAPSTNLFNSGVTFTPHLVFGVTPASANLNYGDTTVLTARFTRNDASAAPPASLRPLIGRALTFSGPSNGTLSNAQTSLQPSGTATANFTANFAGSGGASVNFDGFNAFASIVITSPAPSAGNFSASAAPGRTLTIPFATILAQCSDANGLNPLTVLSTGPSTGQGGASSLVANAVRYTPPSPQFTGADVVSYTIRNAGGGIASGSIFVTVAGPAFPPGPVSVLKTGNSITATFNGFPGLTYTIETTTSLVSPAVWTPLNPPGSVVADANGNFTFTDPSATTRKFYRARSQ